LSFSERQRLETLHLSRLYCAPCHTYSSRNF
jgi:hypothetical protein